MKIVAVTGGSGFFGIAMIRKLLSEGYRVRSFDQNPFVYPEVGQVEHFQGDICDTDAVLRFLNGADAVIHAAAALPLASKEEIQRTNIKGTEVVFRVVSQLGIPRSVFISSTAVYKTPHFSVVTEEHPLCGVGPYGESKIEGEKIAVAARSGATTVTIIRPKTFIGPERLGVFEILFRFAKEGRNFPIIGSGANHYQLLDVDDLATAVLLALRALPMHANETYTIAAAVHCSLKEDFQSVLDCAGHGKRIIAIPRWFAVPILHALYALHLSPLYPWVVDTLSEKSVVSIEKAQSRLGFRPIYSTKEALQRGYLWYASQASIPQGISHRTRWREGILGLARHFF